MRPWRTGADTGQSYEQMRGLAMYSLGIAQDLNDAVVRSSVHGRKCECKVPASGTRVGNLFNRSLPPAKVIRIRTPCTASLQYLFQPQQLVLHRLKG